MWDVIFAIDPMLELVDTICVAMLLRIRWERMPSQSTSVMKMLLLMIPHFPLQSSRQTTLFAYSSSSNIQPRNLLTDPKPLSTMHFISEII